MTHHYCARKLYERNGIPTRWHILMSSNVRSLRAWWAMDWLREFFLLKGMNILKCWRRGDFDSGWENSHQPSGGVIASNPIGARAMLRPAEAALQIRGDAGPHQIKKEVRHALASGLGYISGRPS